MSNLSIEERINKETVAKLKLMIELIESGDFTVQNFEHECTVGNSMELGTFPEGFNTVNLTVGFYTLEGYDPEESQKVYDKYIGDQR